MSIFFLAPRLVSDSDSDSEPGLAWLAVPDVHNLENTVPVCQPTSTNVHGNFLLDAQPKKNTQTPNLFALHNPIKVILQRRMAPAP